MSAPHPALLLQLPPECTLHILKHLPVADVVATAAACTALHATCGDDGLWRDLAIAKWGAAVQELKPLADAVHAEGPAVSWQAYCYQRMSAKTIRASPLSLLQELYADPWQHIICCTLCSRTSGSDVIRVAIAAFFEELPTPTAVLGAPEPLLLELLHPLGLQASRLAAVRSVSHGFLATPWKEPSEFKGCGKFVTDSWRIFCKGCKDSRDVADANLRQYLAWLNRQQATLSGQQEQGGEEQPASGRRRAQGQQKRQRQEQQNQQGPPSARQTRAAARDARSQEPALAAPAAKRMRGAARAAAAGASGGAGVRAEGAARGQDALKGAGSRRDQPTGKAGRSSRGQKEAAGTAAAAASRKGRSAAAPAAKTRLAGAC